MSGGAVKPTMAGVTQARGTAQARATGAPTAGSEPVRTPTPAK
jgi:hypothetical protein